MLEVFITAALFVSDAMSIGNRLTINPGLRFDHSRAISQDVPRSMLDTRPDGSSRAGHGGYLEHLFRRAWE